MGERGSRTPHPLPPFSLSPFSLPWGPPHRAAAQDMQMQVIHALAAISPGIGHDPIAARIEPKFGCNLRSKGKEPAQHPLPHFALGLARGAYVGERDHQHVGRRHWLDIPECNELRRFLHDAATDFTVRDLAENAVSHRLLPNARQRHMLPLPAPLFRIAARSQPAEPEESRLQPHSPAPLD